MENHALIITSSGPIDAIRVGAAVGREFLKYQEQFQATRFPSFHGHKIVSAKLTKPRVPSHVRRLGT